MIEPGRHGVIVGEPDDLAGWAAALARVLQADMRDACRADPPRLHEQLSMARHARELHALYAQVRASTT